MHDDVCYSIWVYIFDCNEVLLVIVLIQHNEWFIGERVPQELPRSDLLNQSNVSLRFYVWIGVWACNLCRGNTNKTRFGLFTYNLNDIRRRFWWVRVFCCIWHFMLYFELFFEIDNCIASSITSTKTDRTHLVSYHSHTLRNTNYLNFFDKLEVFFVIKLVNVHDVVLKADKDVLLTSCRASHFLSVRVKQIRNFLHVRVPIEFDAVTSSQNKSMIEPDFLYHLRSLHERIWRCLLR